MGRKLYVGNLPFSIDDEALAKLFSQAGKVETANVVRDVATGRARGFGFVEMSTDEEAQRAIQQFNETEVEGRAMVVNEARPRSERGGFGGGRGRGGARRHDSAGRGDRRSRW